MNYMSYAKLLYLLTYIMSYLYLYLFYKMNKKLKLYFSSLIFTSNKNYIMFQYLLFKKKIENFSYVW